MKNLTLLICLFNSLPALAQTKIPVEAFITNLNHNKYAQVYDDIQRIREKMRYAKSPTLDYFEAKCLCLNGSRDDAYSIYSKMLQSNQFSNQEKDFLYLEFASCGPAETGNPSISSNTAAKPITLTLAMIPSTLRGKLGDVSDCYDYKQYIDFSAMPSADSLQTRVVDKKNKGKAFRQWKSLLKDHYRIDTISDRFVIVTPLNNTPAQVADAVAKLQKGADFYARYYSLSPPEQLITVFMMPDIREMQTLSKLIHGIDLPSTNLGYSNLSDLTLVGISDVQHVGTIYHELFHLMIRADVGDLPVWLDEGLASLYAMSFWKDDQLLGLTQGNWRTNVLREAKESRDYSLRYPSIGLLTTYTYDEFNGSDYNNICRASVNYAMANHLMLYFQERHLLQQIVAAYRKRSIIDLAHPTRYVTNTRILEKAIGESMDSLDRHFTGWMFKTYQLDMKYDRVNSSIPTFNEIFGTHFSTLQDALYQKKPDAVPEFRRRSDELEDTYRNLAEPTELTKFYTAEDNRIHGLYNPYVNSEQYTVIKALYDQVMELELDIRKAIFD